MSFNKEQLYWNYYFPENQREEQNEIANTRTWAHPTATVYIDISNNSQLIKATKEAIKDWNKTGAFTFKEVHDSSKANIIVQAVNNSNTTAAGVTSTTYNPITGHLLTANVQLNTYYLQNKTYDYNYQRIMYTAEHELGHANNSSVMYPKGSYYPIQIQDIRAVRSLYA